MQKFKVGDVLEDKENGIMAIVFFQKDTWLSYLKSHIDFCRQGQIQQSVGISLVDLIYKRKELT